MVEESPSPFITEETRKKMGNAAVAACKAIKYDNAGTVEFIVAPDQSFYFLEVNTSPGMTDHSLVPMAAKAAGVSFDELVVKILSMTLGHKNVG